MTSLLKPEEAAKLLRVSKEELRLWRRRGTGPVYYRISPKVIRYSGEGIAEWLTRSPQSGACVYFLMSGDRVVYVGQSACLYARLLQHGSDKGKSFDRVLWIPIHKEDLDMVEAAFIHFLKPPLNVSRPRPAMSLYPGTRDHGTAQN